MKLYVNKNLIFDGTLDRGGGEGPADLSVLVGPRNEKEGRTEKAPSGERDACKMVGTDRECSQPAGAAVDVKVSLQGKSFGEKMSPPRCRKDNLSKLNEDTSLIAAPASMGGMPWAPPLRPAVECPPLDPELSLIQQLENLTGRKASETPAKTPSWLQPSAAGQGRKQGVRKPKPLWLSPEKPLDREGRLLPDDLIDPQEGPQEAELGDKGPRREQGQVSSWNVVAGERVQKVTPTVCDDFDIFNQPSNREHPASGRRGPRKDALSSGPSDAQPPSRGKLNKRSDSGAIVPECRPPIPMIAFRSMDLCSLPQMRVSSSAKQGGSSQPPWSQIHCLRGHRGGSMGKTHSAP